MTTLETLLGEIEKRVEAATHGPWSSKLIESVENWYQVGKESFGPIKDQQNFREVCSFETWSNPNGQIAQTSKADAEFIAHAREDLPRLLKAVRLVREQRDMWIVLDGHSEIKDECDAAVARVLEGKE